LRPARSKHSAITNQCVSKFDHYCIWIKGDVGEKNYKFFLGFIGGHALLTLYGVFFGISVLLGLIEKEGLWGAKFRSMETGEIFTAGVMTIFQVAISDLVLTESVSDLRILSDTMHSDVRSIDFVLHIPYVLGEARFYHKREN
jgi:DHHC palmitoyltransferase